MNDLTPARRASAHSDLLVVDQRRERSVLWRFALAGALTVCLALARQWWWV